MKVFVQLRMAGREKPVYTRACASSGSVLNKGKPLCTARSQILCLFCEFPASCRAPIGIGWRWCRGPRRRCRWWGGRGWSRRARLTWWLSSRWKRFLQNKIQVVKMYHQHGAINRPQNRRRGHRGCCAPPLARRSVAVVREPSLTKVESRHDVQKVTYPYPS